MYIIREATVSAHVYETAWGLPRNEFNNRKSVVPKLHMSEAQKRVNGNVVKSKKPNTELHEEMKSSRFEFPFQN